MNEQKNLYNGTSGRYFHITEDVGAAYLHQQHLKMRQSVIHKTSQVKKKKK